MKVFTVLAICVAVALAHDDVIFAAEGDSAITLQDYYDQTAGEHRIIDGRPAVPGQFPWQVSLRTKTVSGTAFCGGALISNVWVLTAAHCVRSWRSIHLEVGGVTLANSERGRVSRSAARVIIHAKYNSNNNNDVALIKLNSAVTLSNRIQVIRLPSRGETLGSGLAIKVSGWGRTSDQSSGVSQQLMWVDLTTITNAECAAVYGTSSIIRSVVCARGHPHHSTCNGDSGGPLIRIQNRVATHVGVVNFVHRDGCGSGNPSGYARTESFLPWIATQTGLKV